jgi:predicted DNA-binding transcriptional regulator AlpA
VSGDLLLGDPSTLTRDVLFIDDVASVLRTSRSTIERRRRAGTFPIPELPSFDGRPRWSRQAVNAYLASTNGGLKPRRGRPRLGRGELR